MANEIVNHLSIKGDKLEISKLYNSIKRDTEEKVYGYNIIDFNKIIPMPKEISDLVKENGCANDYYFNWVRKHWGSKGNCFNLNGIINTESDIRFETSGGNALKLIKRLSKMFPNLELEYSWFDDHDLGSNVGKCVIKNEVLLDSVKFDNKSKEAFEFIFKLEKCSPKEKGLFYNSENEIYDYIED